MLQCEVLIFKLVSVDGFSSSAIMIGEISTLAHEVGDDTVENASFIPKTFFACTQGTEIFSCFWYNITAKLSMKKSISI